MVGALAQYGTDSYDFSFINQSLSTNRYYAGIEGQYSFDNLTLYAQAGYMDLSVQGQDIDGFFAAGQARYFLQPNWKIAGTLGYNKISQNGFDLSTWNAGAETEYRLANMPINGFLKYDYVHTDYDGAGDISTNTVMAGLKLDLGTNTLLDRDHHGASLEQVLTKTNLFLFGL